ncbi:MAG: hypothetical protein LR001_05490 [Clostridiales bacterium]|nr:hypothetical protein [Clostridiales bacterium]
MNRSYSKYINKVLKRINCSSEYKTRIREDLNIILHEKSIKLRETDPYKLLGNPGDVAVEFAENMGVDLFSKYAYVSETTFLGMPLIRVVDGKHRYIEYKSKKEFMGFPLVHVNNKPYGVAKGIIAVGSISIGVISVGGISFGLISLGGISFAILLGMGGVALSLIAAIGGATIGGFFAFGGLAMSNYISIGGLLLHENLLLGDMLELE